MAEPHPSSGPLPPNTNNGTWVLPLDWTLRSFALLVVILRLITRRVIKNTAGWDDLAISLAMLISIVGGIGDTIRVDNGFGRHAAYLTPAQLSINARGVIISQLANFIGLFFTRLSVSIFILRLLPRQNTDCRVWRRLTLATIPLNFVSTLASVLVAALQCIPLSTLWTSGPGAHDACSEHMLTVALPVTGVFNVLTDFALALVPAAAIRGLQMNRRLRLEISAVMALSLATAACSIGKVVAASRIVDVTYDSVPVQCWGMFEENGAIVFASAPALRQLWRAVVTRRGLGGSGSRVGGAASTPGPSGYASLDRRERSADGARKSSEISLVPSKDTAKGHIVFQTKEVGSSHV